MVRIHFDLLLVSPATRFEGGDGYCLALGLVYLFLRRGLVLFGWVRMTVVVRLRQTFCSDRWIEINGRGRTESKSLGDTLISFPFFPLGQGNNTSI